MGINTADVVLHRPTGETWVVAFVEGEHLYWCGWPEGCVALADCELVKKATEMERHNLLLQMRGTQGVRGGYAARVLEDGVM